MNGLVGNTGAKLKLNTKKIYAKTILQADVVPIENVVKIHACAA